MSYTEDMNILMNQLNKSISQGSRLAYFKTELLKVLDKKEAQENQLSKAISAYFDSMSKSLLEEFGIEKGKVATVGEIRTWKDGKKYKKMPNGKWVRIYQSQNRSAEISIARLKGRIKNAKSIDELMQIVMANVHRFEDENGKFLPIVEELKKEVASSKGKLNAGKPTTQQQIDTFKQNQTKSKKYMPKYILDTSYGAEEKVVDSVHPNQIKVGDKFLGSGWNTTYGRKILTVANITVTKTGINKYEYRITDENGDEYSYYVGEYGHTNVSKIKDDYDFQPSKLDKIVDKLENAKYLTDNQEKYNKLNELNDELEKYKQEAIGNEYRIADRIQQDVHIKIQGAYWMLPEQLEKKKKIEEEADKIENQFREEIRNLVEIVDYDELYQARLNLIKKMKKQIKENDKRIAEIENNTASYPFNSLNFYLEGRIERLKKENANINEKRASVKNASDELMNGKKEYSFEEVKEAYEKANKIKDIFKNYRAEIQDVEARIKVKNREWMNLRWSGNDAEVQRISREKKDIEFERDTIFANVKNYSKELDKYMDIIIDDIINQPVEHDTEALDKITDTNGFLDYMTYNNYFNENGNKNSDLDGVDPKLARKTVEMFDQLFTVMNLKGQLSGTRCNLIGKNTYAQVHWGTTSIEMNKLWFSNNDKFVNSFNNDIASGFHPDGKPEQIIIHEATHTMVNHVITPQFMDMAKVIKEKVMDKYKIKGMKKKDIITKYVSGYATKNADEFCAEAFTRGLVGKDKNNLCRDVVKEFVKAVNYLGGLYA